MYLGIVGVFALTALLLNKAHESPKAYLQVNAGFSLLLTVVLIIMCEQHRNTFYLALVLMPMLYANTVVPFRWLIAVYISQVTMVEAAWFNFSMHLISARGHLLRGLLVSFALLQLFIKYVSEFYERENFKFSRVL